MGNVKNLVGYRVKKQEKEKHKIEYKIFLVNRIKKHCNYYLDGLINEEEYKNSVTDFLNRV